LYLNSSGKNSKEPLNTDMMCVIPCSFIAAQFEADAKSPIKIFSVIADAENLLLNKGCT
jgi:hypothetical protein